MKKALIDLIFSDRKTIIDTIFKFFYCGRFDRYFATYAKISKEWEYLWRLWFLKDFLLFIVFNYYLLRNISNFLGILLLRLRREVIHDILPLNLACFLIDSWRMHGEGWLWNMESSVLLKLALCRYVFPRRLEWKLDIMKLILVHLNRNLFLNFQRSNIFLLDIKTSFNFLELIPTAYINLRN